MQIIPSILTNNPQELKSLINLAEGHVERIQIDIIDGKFAENKTIIPEALVYIETNLKLDFHLMVVEPVNWVESCVRAGADRIFGQVEKMTNQDEFVQKVVGTGSSVGLAIDLGTHLSALNNRLLLDIDAVLVMSVKAGFGGQVFNPSVLSKIKTLSDLKKEDPSPFQICVDGGITLSSIKSLIDAGADEASIGRRLLNENFAKNLAEYQKATHGR